MAKKLEKTKLVQYVVDKFLKEKTARIKKENTWRTIENIYNRYDPNPPEAEWESAIVPADAYNAVEQATTLIKNQLFSGKEFFDLEIEDESLTESVERAQKQFNNTITKSNFLMQFELFLKQLIALGSAVLYVMPDGKIRPIPVTDFVFTPTKLQTAMEADLFIYRYVASLAGVKANKQFTNTENLQAETFNDGFESNDAGKESKEDVCELMLCYGTVVIDGQATPDVFAVICNRKELIYFDQKPNNINPFVFCTYKQNPFDPYGVGIIEKIVGDFETLQNSTRSLNDELRLSVHAPTIYDANDNMLDLSILQTGIEPGMLIAATNPASLVKFASQNPMINEMFQQILSLKQTINETTGVIRAIGVTNSGAKLANTATEAELMAGQGELGFTHITKHINEMALIPTLRKTLHYYLANSKEPDDKKLLEVIENVNFHISALGSVLEKRDKIQNLRGLLVDLAQLPPELTAQVNVPEMIKEIVTLTLADQYNIEKFLNAAPPAQAPPVDPNSPPMPVNGEEPNPNTQQEPPSNV